MTRVHVVGAAGYGAAEFVRLALGHPHLELGALESASHAGQPIAAAAPGLRGLERPFDPPGTLLGALSAGDAVLFAGGAEGARSAVPALLERGARVVDLSDAFRLNATAHGAVYGATERYRQALREANFVANPGCYPTATLLALAPLAEFASDVQHVIVDAKSGITGAGRTPATSSLFAEVEGDVRAYGLDGHRHEPEIRQELDALGITAPLVFTPHVVPLGRGMLVDAYATMRSAPDERAVMAAFSRLYAREPFVRLLPAGRAPSLRAVERTNDAELLVSVIGNVIRVIAAIDNLGKGAAGQALQNFNVMFGFSEAEGLQ